MLLCMIGLVNGKMADLSKVHHIVIGYDKIEEYKININILRNVFVKGKDLLITAIYNGNNYNEIEEKYKSEEVNNFIILKENKGYVWGAIDAIQKGLTFVDTLTDRRDIVLLTNFDGFFFSEERYNKLVDDFIKSGKLFGAGFSHEVKHLFSDLLLFRKEFVSSFCEGMDKVKAERVDWTCEKHVGSTLNVIGSVDKLWWRFERDNNEQQGRNYIFHKEYGFGHCHGKDNIEDKMNEHDTLDLYLLNNKIFTGTGQLDLFATHRGSRVPLTAVGYI